jgi:hypothetical protein
MVKRKVFFRKHFKNFVMTKLEIEKEIRKTKPAAEIVEVNKTGIVYKSFPNNSQVHIAFLVPLTDIGEGRFQANEQSQLLIRYLLTQE